MDFFFSSRRRHTRWPRDWSSDVCSSDLAVIFQQLVIGECYVIGQVLADAPNQCMFALGVTPSRFAVQLEAFAKRRSEERRVGKEWRSRGSMETRRKKAANRKESERQYDS